MGVAATSLGDRGNTEMPRREVLGHPPGCVASCLPAWEDAGRQPDHTTLATQGGIRNAALDSLRDELGDDSAVSRFLANYLALLDQRIAAIGQALREGRSEECITLLLTLETSSHMVGADDLTLRAAALRLALGHRQIDTDALFADVARAGLAAREQLSVL